MKMKLLATAVIALSMSQAIAAEISATNAGLQSDVDKLSYSIGVDLGKNFKKQEINVNPAMMAKGMQDGIQGSPLALTEEEMKEALTQFQKNMIAKHNEAFKKVADENKAKGEAFLEDNKKKEGVVSLPSGLQYKIIQNGSGPKPSKDDSVTVDYTGKLINGKVFDSSEKTGKSATFKVSQVIPGWTEVLQLMPTGSTWEVYVPASLAYGDRSISSAIGPNETLVFHIHLISVKKAS